MGQAEIVTGQPSLALAIEQVAGANFPALAAGAKPSVGLVYDYQQWTTNTLPSLLRLIPYSTINNGTSVGMRVIGWNEAMQANGTPMYFPTILGEFVLTYTSGTVPSPSFDFGVVQACALFSGITHVAGTPAPNRYSPATVNAADTAIASVMIDVIGSQYVTLNFKSSGSPTMGAFWCTI
jgi:hypothetical protein